MTSVGDMICASRSVASSCAIDVSGWRESAVRSYSIESMRPRSVRTLQRSAQHI